MKIKDFPKFSPVSRFLRHKCRKSRRLTPATSEELVELGHILDVEFYTDPCRCVEGDYNTRIMRNGSDAMFYVDVGDMFPTRFALRLTSGKSPEEAENEMAHYMWNNTTSLHTEHESFRFPMHDSAEELHMRLSVMGSALWSKKH